MIVVVDFDDVMVDFMRPFLAWYGDNFGHAVDYEEMWSYDLHRVLDIEIELAEAIVMRFWRGDAHRRIVPFADADAGLAALFAAGIEVHMATARPQAVATETRYLLDRHFAHCPFAAVHYLGSFHEPSSLRRSKADVVRQLDADALIDDSFGNCRGALGGRAKIIMPDRPWNRRLEAAGISRIYTWQDTLACLL